MTKRDAVKYFEAVSLTGDLREGTAKELGKLFKIHRQRITNSARDGTRIVDGDDVYKIECVGELKRVFDCYIGEEYICTGTFEEVAAHTGRKVRTVKYASGNAALERLELHSSQRSLILIEHCERELRELPSEVIQD